jgi:hypothetical protein
LPSNAETIEAAIPDIMRLIQKDWSSFLDLRLLIITPSQWLYVHNGRMEPHYELIENAMIERIGRARHLVRGDAINFVSKLESLVREIIQARILGLFSPKVREFDDVLKKVPFDGCIKLLIKWKVIEGDLKSKIEGLKNVRNQLAHSWSESDVLYKNISLYDNIEEFRKDAKEVWISLIEIYMKDEVKDLGILLNKLGDYNTINVWSDITKERESRGYTDIDTDEE